MWSVTGKVFELSTQAPKSMGRYGPWVEVGKPAPGSKKQRSSEREISGPPSAPAACAAKRNKTEQNERATGDGRGRGFFATSRRSFVDWGRIGAGCSVRTELGSQTGNRHRDGTDELNCESWDEMEEEMEEEMMGLPW